MTSLYFLPENYHFLMTPECILCGAENYWSAVQTHAGVSFIIRARHDKELKVNKLLLSAKRQERVNVSLVFPVKFPLNRSFIMREPL